MPIYDQGYVRWDGEIPPRPVRWWPILRRGFLAELRRRRTLFFLLVSWAIILVKGVILYTDLRAGSLLSGAQLVDSGRPFFYGALKGQWIFVTLFILLAGTDLIAQDRRYHALQIYFSKPLTPNDYILGKLGIVSGFVFLVSWLPVLLLWLFAVLVNTRDGYFAAVWSVPLAATAHCLVWALVAGLMILALSAVAQRTAIIAVSWLLLYGLLVVGGIAQLLQALTGWAFWGLIDVHSNIQQVGAWFFGVEGPHDFHPFFSLLLLVGVVAASYSTLRRRIQPVEVVL
jgi:ABC-type transport system involved in multi-copper enzyme maturation permease subunit